MMCKFHCGWTRTGYIFCVLLIFIFEGNDTWGKTSQNFGYKPHQIEDKNFSCLSENFEKLTCCWSPPYNPVKTNYILENYLIIGKLFVGYRNCPKNDGINNTCCQWREDTNPPYDKIQKTLRFRLTGHNQLGTITQRIKIDHYKYVLPSPPWLLQLTEKTQNSIRLQWFHPKNFDYGRFEPGLRYELSYKALFPEDQEWKVNSVGIGRKTYNVTGLIPNTQYKFLVRCRSALADQKDMWSKPATIIAHTDPDVPYNLPNITREAYEIKQFTSYRSITLYWKPVSLKYYNGENFHYVITYKPTLNQYEEEEVSENIVEVTGTKHTFSGMDYHTGYYFKLQSANKEGLSSSSVSITIDEMSKLLAVPDEVTVISYKNRNYRVIWDYPEKSKSPVSGFTVFWCQSLHPHLCEHPIQWRSVPVSKRYEFIQLSGDINYQFAVSAVSTANSSGMKWASCIMSYEEALAKVQNIRLAPGIRHLKVEWELPCSAQKNVVLRYKIEYCAVENSHQRCHGGLKSMTVEQNATEVKINYLKPFTFYRVTLQVFSEAGIGELSDPKFERTKSEAPPAPWDVKVLHINSSVMHLTWKAPFVPNGVISHYIVHYNNNSQEVFVKEGNKLPSVVLWKELESYTNYSITVKACSDTQCSPPSQTVYGMTEINAPSMMKEPHIEVINPTTVHVRWLPPNHPNGPIKFYLLNINWQSEGNRSYSEFFNISGSMTSIVIPLNCPVEMDSFTNFSFAIQAVNIRNNTHLPGPTSPSTYTKICFSEGLQVEIITGIAFGGTIGLLLLVVVLYFLVCWMKKKINLMKKTMVQLPSGLDHALNTDHFTGFDELKNQELKNFPYVTSFTNELYQKKTRSINFGRNPNGDSSVGDSAGECGGTSTSSSNCTHISSEYNIQPHSFLLHMSDAVFLNYHPVESEYFLTVSQTKQRPSNVIMLHEFENNSYQIHCEKENGLSKKMINICDSRAFKKYVIHHNIKSLSTINSSNSELFIFNIKDKEKGYTDSFSLTGPPYFKFCLSKNLCLTLNSLMSEEQPEKVYPRPRHSKFGVHHIWGYSKLYHFPEITDNNLQDGINLVPSSQYRILPQFSLKKMPPKNYILTKPKSNSNEINSLISTQNPTPNIILYKNVYSKICLPNQISASGENDNFSNVFLLGTFCEVKDNKDYLQFSEVKDNKDYSEFETKPYFVQEEFSGEVRQESQLLETSYVNLKKNSSCDNLSIAAISGNSTFDEKVTSIFDLMKFKKKQVDFQKHQSVNHSIVPNCKITVLEFLEEQSCSTKEDPINSTNFVSSVSIDIEELGKENTTYVPQCLPFFVPDGFNNSCMKLKVKNQDNGYVRWKDSVEETANSCPPELIQEKIAKSKE